MTWSCCMWVNVANYETLDAAELTAYPDVLPPLCTTLSPAFRLGCLTALHTLPQPRRALSHLRSPASRLQRQCAAQYPCATESIGMLPHMRSMATKLRG